MNNPFKKIFSFSGNNQSKNQERSGESDFSAFFSKPSRDKAKVIRRVLHEANEEQRRVMEEHKKAAAQ